MITERINIDVRPGGVPIVVHVTQYEVGLRTFEFVPFTSSGEWTDVTGSATLEGTKPDGNAFQQACEMVDGVITYTLQEQLCAVEGRVWSRLVIRDTDGGMIGYTAIVWVVGCAGVKDDAVMSDSDISALRQFLDEFGTIDAYRGALNGALAAVGGPLVAATASAMTDTTKVYVYTGSESGYTEGHWYYWNGSAWTDGGVYQSTGINTDKTLTVEDMAADAKATGDAVADLKNATTKLDDFCVTLGMDDVVLNNNDFIGGAWLNAQGYRNDGNYGKMRVNLTAIPLKNYNVNVETSDVNTKVALTLFSDDSGETFLAGYPQNVSVSNSIYHIDTQDILSHFPGTKTIRINIYEYDGSSFSSTTDLVLSAVYVSDKTIVDSVDELDNAVNIINLHETDYMFPVNEKNIINIIGDSITAGVYSDNAMIDSYAGILRNLMSKHLGNHLNFGFAPFTIQDGYRAGYWSTNILQIGDRGTAIRINYASGSPMFGKMYGTEGYELVDTDSAFRFKILDNAIQKFRLAYVSGVNSTINVYKRKNAVSTLLLTIDCTGETVKPAYSDIIDLGELNDSNTQIYLYLGSGEGAYISGIQIINDVNYATFNNYSLPGAATVHQTDVLIQSEIDCDLLIWALGFNDRNDPTSFKTNIDRWTPMIQAKRCYCIVLDFQWDRTNECKPVLKQMAKDLNCIYLDFAEIVPRKANGQIINNFLAADGVHPVALGHRFIGEYIAKTLGLDFTSKMQVLGA